MQEHLDLSSVEAFVQIAELKSFTQAAEALGTTQACISLKIKKLEKLVGYQLLERTPRHVRLSLAGEQFIEHAREILESQERALAPLKTSTRRFSLGVSDFVAGAELPRLLAKTCAFNERIVIEAKVGTSSELLEAYDRGELDAVMVRCERRRRDGAELFTDDYAWYGNACLDDGVPLRLVSVSVNCGIRSIAARSLNDANIPWVSSFVGGSLTDVIEAVSCGLGVAPLPCRLAPASLPRVPKGRLPALPPSSIVLHTFTRDKVVHKTLKYFIDCLANPMQSATLLRVA